VIVRGLEVFLNVMREAKDDTRAEWAQTALAAERARITTALAFLEDICAAFEYEEYDVAVIKSLDHWPDLGSDLDLYTNANSEDIAKLLRRHFDCLLYTSGKPRRPRRHARHRRRNPLVSCAARRSLVPPELRRPHRLAR